MDHLILEERNLANTQQQIDRELIQPFVRLATLSQRHPIELIRLQRLSLVGRILAAELRQRTIVRIDLRQQRLNFRIGLELRRLLLEDEICPHTASRVISLADRQIQYTSKIVNSKRYFHQI